ncbi:GIY-YIG nuclease family protein [bacterium]|nr:GIY-YIG nuclease family protein [bacterium]
MNKNETTYQLIIKLNKNLLINVGKLGAIDFQKGTYFYTGSAKKNMEARIERHNSNYKKLHWHIDYLTILPQVQIEDVLYFSEDECTVNQKTAGIIPVPGFGASDCKQKCISHLKFSR